MKVRFMCLKHECDLDWEGGKVYPRAVVEELVGGNTTGFYLFDLSDAYCPEQAGDGPDYCPGQWSPVLYAA